MVETFFKDASFDIVGLRLKRFRIFFHLVQFRLFNLVPWRGKFDPSPALDSEPSFLLRRHRRWRERLVEVNDAFIAVTANNEWDSPGLIQLRHEVVEDRFKSARGNDDV